MIIGWIIIHAYKEERHHLMTKPTRTPAKGNAIVLDFGDTMIPAHLNESETARAFAGALPVTVHVGATDVDFCGQLGLTLPYDEAQRGNGWLNGDINYNPHGGWFVVFRGGEDESASYDDQVNIGVVDCDIEELEALTGNRSVTISRA